LRQIELDTDKAEGELEILEEKLQQHETRLFAGGMSARETEHMRLEVQGLRGQKGASEERVLGLLDQLDPAREDVARLEAQRQVLARRSRSWSRRSPTSGADRCRAGPQGGAQAGGDLPIPEDLVELYEKLRSTKEGVGVGRLDNDTCGGCHMRLSPAEVAEVKKADPPRCVHCRRILVI
jgi:uncharacterized protein